MAQIETFMIPVLSIDRTLTVDDAKARMQERNVTSLLVTAFEEYVGIITENDIQSKVTEKGLDPLHTPISAAMTRSVLSVDRFTTVEKAKGFMQSKGIGHLAVTEKGFIVGVLSSKDLAATLKKSARL